MMATEYELRAKHVHSDHSETFISGKAKCDSAKFLS